MTKMKLLAAAISGILAAGMLSALPAAAYRPQLGEYRRVGESGLYISDSGAIQVDSEDTSGILLTVQLPQEQEPAFRSALREKIRQYFHEMPDAPARYVFDFDEIRTDTHHKGTADAPAYTYTLTDKQQGEDFYAAAASLYADLHLTCEGLKAFKYYPDFGCTNYAGCYGYAVAGKPEMKNAIAAWLAEHAPDVEARMSDDDEILNLGWKETGDDREYEPYNPYPDMYAIWRDLGYVPFYSSTEMYRYGDEFAIDFMQYQKYYDGVSEAQMQKAWEKYALDDIADSPYPYRVYLLLPDSTVRTLAKRAGSLYDPSAESAAPWIPDADMLAEGLNIGFAAGIRSDTDPEACQNILIGDKDFGHGWAVQLTAHQPAAGDPAGEPEYLLKPQEIARILAYLDLNLGLPFGVQTELPSQGAATGDLNLDGAADVSDAVLLARFFVSDSSAKISDQGMKNADVNKDGGVTADDLDALLRRIARME